MGEAEHLAWLLGTRQQGMAEMGVGQAELVVMKVEAQPEQYWLQAASKNQMSPEFWFEHPH